MFQSLVVGIVAFLVTQCLTGEAYISAAAGFISFIIWLMFGERWR